MAEVHSKRGDILMRQRMACRLSCNVADRILFAKYVERQRAWVDLLLGSTIACEEKVALLRETFARILSGRSKLSARLYDSVETFERDLRRHLRERCDNLQGGLGG